MAASVIGSCAIGGTVMVSWILMVSAKLDSWYAKETLVSIIWGGSSSAVCCRDFAMGSLKWK